MAQAVPESVNVRSERRAWLQVAERVKDEAGATEDLRHPPLPDASVKRLRELAGIITLHGPLPSREFLDVGRDAT